MVSAGYSGEVIGKVTKKKSVKFFVPGDGVGLVPPCRTLYSCSSMAGRGNAGGSLTSGTVELVTHIFGQAVTF